jgi:hypothetical protein
VSGAWAPVSTSSGPPALGERLADPLERAVVVGVARVRFEISAIRCRMRRGPGCRRSVPRRCWRAGLYAGFRLGRCAELGRCPEKASDQRKRYSAVIAVDPRFALVLSQQCPNGTPPLPTAAVEVLEAEPARALAPAGVPGSTPNHPYNSRPSLQI